MIDFEKIKLVIWDLDDTFWSGTLSEGEITPIDMNVSIVKLSTDIGIINSICSKNSEKDTLRELEKLGVDDFFVFKSINWQPKGERVSSIIKRMGLRAVNVVFVDDNVQNLNEAKHYSEGLLTALPQDFLNHFYKWLLSKPISDKEHKRLKQYKILEEKEKDRNEYSSNEDFLFDCDLRVLIHHDCISKIDRIAELVQRSNQLNFTKLRDDKEKLRALINNENIHSGYVTVSDKYGDYGLVGFYAIDKLKNRCIHFLFSCRTIGQGVEQYVYAQLGYPKLDVVGSVINMVDNSPSPKWINQKNGKVKKVNRERIAQNFRVLFKGPCDILGITNFLKGQCEVDEELTYIGEKCNQIEAQNHSVSIIGLMDYSETEKQELLEDCDFLDKNYWKSEIFSQKYNLVFLSTLLESNIGLYRKKGTNLVIPFGEGFFPITEPQNWDGYISGEIFNSQNVFTRSFLEKFSEKYEFVGMSTPFSYIKSLERIINKLDEDTSICLILGSEIPYIKNSKPAYRDRHILHRNFNEEIRCFAKNNKRIILIDINDFISGQNDFNGNINHFTVNVYYKVAEYVKDIINEKAGSMQVKRKSCIDKYSYFIITRIKDVIKNHVSQQNKLFRLVRNLYRKFK